MQGQPSTQLHTADLLLNDLYQFTCSYSYFLSNKHEQEATFEVFFRKYPFGGEYVIAAGIQSVKNLLKNLCLTKAQQQTLHQCLPNLSKQYFAWAEQDFSSRIKIKSVHQGEVVFAKEPIITYTGPLGFVQLLQTPILNLIGFASLVATNASRMAKAVEPKKCIEFGLRRAQGPDGGLSASHYAFLGGFVGTSNVKAGAALGIPVVGTMSHAFVTAFNSLKDAQQFQINNVNVKQRAIAIRNQLHFENTHQGQLASFIMYAKAFPNNFTTLVDTYHTVQSGLLNTIIVAKVLFEAGIYNIGVRLDSGDLCELSKEVRQTWNKYVSEHKLKIFASDDLHEQRLVQMQNKGSEIDCYAIGTNIATCKKQPALGLVCKLVSLEGRPKMKFSGDVGKATYPGLKSIYRVWVSSEPIASFDLISLEGEQLKDVITVVENQIKSQVKIYRLLELNPVWNYLPQNLIESKSHLKHAQQNLPDSIFGLKEPNKFKVLMTSAYWDVLQATIKANTIPNQ